MEKRIETPNSKIKYALNDTEQTKQILANFGGTEFLATISSESDTKQVLDKSKNIVQVDAKNVLVQEEPKQ